VTHLCRPPDLSSSARSQKPAGFGPRRVPARLQAGHAAGIARILSLQRAAGNRAVTKAIRAQLTPLPLQRGLFDEASISTVKVVDGVNETAPVATGFATDTTGGDLNVPGPSTDVGTDVASGTLIVRGNLGLQVHCRVVGYPFKVSATRRLLDKVITYGKGKPAQRTVQHPGHADGPSDGEVVRTNNSIVIADAPGLITSLDNSKFPFEYNARFELTLYSGVFSKTPIKTVRYTMFLKWDDPMIGLPKGGAALE
jgi:hypothetical protein